MDVKKLHEIYAAKGGDGATALAKAVRQASSPSITAIGKIAELVAEQAKTSLIASSGIQEMVRQAAVRSSADLYNAIGKAAIEAQTARSTLVSEMVKGMGSGLWEAQVHFAANAVRLASAHAGIGKMAEQTLREHSETLCRLSGGFATQFESPVAKFARTEDYVSPMPVLRLLQQTQAEPSPNLAAEFMSRFTEHCEQAKQEAEEKGGRLVVTCQTPAGDDISVRQVRNIDDHFIAVTGVDAQGMLREFKAHFSAVKIGIEVVFDVYEDQEEAKETVN